MNTTASPEDLRAEMVDEVRKAGYAQRTEVERVLRDTPRHEFVPEADLQAAHNPWQAVITHRFSDGRSLSCASAPFVVAMMLDQLQIEPGNRILEIGAGTGYNASLLARLTGQADLVTTIDIDPDVTEQAVRALATAGHGAVHVITGDGALGWPDHAPYDRIIATVSPWDIPEAWWKQLAPGARLVAPLRWRGQARSVALTYIDGRLVADSMQLCGFVYLITDGEGELSGAINVAESVKLHWDRDQQVDLGLLHGILDQPRTTMWSGVTIGGNEPHDGIFLRLTITDQRICRISATAEAVPEIVDPVPGYWRPALVEGDSLVYLTCRRQEIDGVVRWELGAIGHGPAAAWLGEHLCDEVRAWAPERDQRKPNLVIYPAGTPDAELNGPAIDKIHSRLVLTYDDNS